MVALRYGLVKGFWQKTPKFLEIFGTVVPGHVAMSHEHNFRGKRMREAMDKAGLTSGQVAYRMGVSDGTVRGWTTGRRGIGPDELAAFAGIVGYPVDYFMYQECQLPGDFSLRYEVKRLAEEVAKLVERIDKEGGAYITTDDEAIDYLQRVHHLPEKDVKVIRRIIEKATA